MNFSENDKEHLDKLLKMRDNGEISNEEYQRRCWATIKEKGNKSPASPFIGSSTVIEDAISAKSESREEPPSQGRLRASGKRQPFSQSRQAGLTVHISVSGMFDRFQKSRTTAGHAMLFPQRGHPLIKILVGLFASMTITIVVARALFERPAAPSSATPVIQSAPLMRIEPLFGPLAVSSCSSKCEAKPSETKAACIRACEKLSLRNYARRITTDEPIPGADAEEICRRCTKAELGSSRFESAEQWEAAAKSASIGLNRLTSTIADFGMARQAFTEMYEVNQRLMLPPAGLDKEAAITEELAQATCLRANLALVEMALALLRHQPDEYSKRFYFNLHKALSPKTLDFENALLQDGKVTELLGNAKRAR